MQILINWAISALIILVLAFILPGVVITGFLAALAVALVIGLIHAFLRPLALLLTLPINILTLGLFTFVIDALLVLLAAKITPGFNVKNFWWALIFALALSLTNAVIKKSTKSRPNPEKIY